MPELATYCKELAVMALTTRVGNRMCHYHTRYTNHTLTDAKAADQDLHPKITGVPYARTAVKFRIKKETNEEEDEDDGNATDTSTGSYKPRTSTNCVRRRNELWVLFRRRPSGLFLLEGHGGYLSNNSIQEAGVEK
jgi:hypothetical protein